MLKSKTFRAGMHTKYPQIKQNNLIFFSPRKEKIREKQTDGPNPLSDVQVIHEKVAFVFSHPSLLKLEVLQPGD